MIEKVEECFEFSNHVLTHKINQLVDAVNALVKENNIHEKQIDELQMKMEPKKCEPAKNAQDENPRCPFCGEELYYVQKTNGGFEILACNCPDSFWLLGNDKMWYNLEKVTTDLDRTKKQLEAAKTLITEIKTVIAEQDLEPQELEQKE